MAVYVISIIISLLSLLAVWSLFFRSKGRVESVSINAPFIVTDRAVVKVLGRDISAYNIVWNEPNREGAPPLFIASKGERYPTLTGVSWLDESRLVVNHRCGMRVALFDLRSGHQPITIGSTPCPTDAIASRKVGDEVWQILLSGCWSNIYSLFELSTMPVASFKFLSEQPHHDKTFSHGVAFDTSGQICAALHAGADPRIIIGKQTSRLEKPWGARDLCFDKASGHVFAVAVSANPKRSAYKKTSTSIWKCEDGIWSWKPVAAIDNVHSDSCKIYKGRLWLADQLGDRVVAYNLERGGVDIVIQGNELDYPHSLSISNDGQLAVSNYGNSAITILNIAEL